jgi:hypothetical protein
VAVPSEARDGATPHTFKGRQAAGSGLYRRCHRADIRLTCGYVIGVFYLGIVGNLYLFHLSPLLRIGHQSCVQISIGPSNESLI